MITIDNVISGIKKFILLQIDKLSEGSPLIQFMKPLIIRVVDNGVKNTRSMIELLADANGNIDTGQIIDEMVSNVINTKPFTIKVPYLDNIIIGNGTIQINVPFIDKKVVFNTEDLNTLKELINSN